MRRLAAALVLAGSLAVLPACGSAGAAGGEPAPAPADLAADAVAALLAAGSAHYAVEATADFDGDSAIGGPYGFRFEGDVSLEAVTGKGSITFAGTSLEASLVAGPHEFFVNVMGRWYGTTELGLADAREKLESREEAAKVWRALQTGEGVRKYFDRLFTGEISEGPEVDGEATWKFEGRLNADGLWTLVEELGEARAEDREALEALAHGSRVAFVVGRDDRLPRSLDVSVALSAEELEELGADDFGPLEAFGYAVTVRLSEFGKPVDYEAPEDFQPLDQVFESFLGALG